MGYEYRLQSKSANQTVGLGIRTPSGKRKLEIDGKLGSLNTVWKKKTRNRRKAWMFEYRLKQKNEN